MAIRKAVGAESRDIDVEASSLEQSHPVSYAIFAMARVQRAVAATKLAEAGLFVNQDIMIMQLGESGEVAQKVLARTLRISHVTVAKMVARLERAGLVGCRRSPTDRRLTLVHLTDAGHNLRRHIEGVWDTLEHNASAELRPDQRDAFLDAVAAIRAGIDAASSPEDVQPP